MDIWINNYNVVSFLGVFFFNISFIHCRKVGSSYLGEATAAARTLLPNVNSACGILVAKQWHGCQCLGSLTCTHMLVHVIAEGCMGTIRESALEVDPGRKIPCWTGNQTCLGSLRVYQQSCIPAPYKDVCSSSIIFTCPLTTGVVWAPQMTSQSVSSIFLFPIDFCDLVNSRPVHSLMLSPHLFFCLPCLLPNFTVLCKMVLARDDEWETCPYYFSLHLFMMVRRSSCGPIACWILACTCYP